MKKKTLILLLTIILCMTASVTAAAKTTEDVTLKKVSQDSDSVKLSWTKGKNVKHYLVYRMDMDGMDGYWNVAKTTNTSFTVKNNMNKNWFYQIVVIHKDGSQTISNSIKVFFHLGEDPAVKAVTTSSGKIKVSWDKVTGSGYRVYQKKDDKWVKLADTAKTSYTLDKVTVGKKYTFRVKPYYKDAEGTKHTKGSTAKTASVTAVPARPEFTLKKVNGKVKVTINAVSGVDGYKIYRKNADGKYVVVKTLKKGNGLSYTFKTFGTYTVRSYKKVGENTYYSRYSSKTIKK